MEQRSGGSAGQLSEAAKAAHVRQSELRLIAGPCAITCVMLWGSFLLPHVFPTHEAQIGNRSCCRYATASVSSLLFCFHSLAYSARGRSLSFQPCRSRKE